MSFGRIKSVFSGDGGDGEGEEELVSETHDGDDGTLTRSMQTVSLSATSHMITPIIFFATVIKTKVYFYISSNAVNISLF